MGVHYSEIKCLVGETNPQLRDAICSTLRSQGFGEVSETSSLVKFHHAVRRGGWALIILGDTLDGDDTCFVTRGLRSGKLGDDPFSVVMVMIAEPDSPRLRSIVDSGADDALLMPFSADALMKKILALSGPRKPFIVTWDYMGPERRTQPRPGTATARHFDVPNPLASAILAADYPAARDAARGQIFAERVRRLSVQVHWLATAIHQAATQDTDPQPLFWALEGVGRELMSRLDNAALQDKVNSLRILARRAYTGGQPLAVEAARHLLAAAETLQQDLGGF